MKKIFLLLFIASVQMVHGQLSNLNLESWTTTANGPEPSLWQYDDGTGNLLYGTYNAYASLSTSRVTGAQAAGGSGSSAKLTTIGDVPGLLYQFKSFTGTVPQAVSFSMKNQTAVNDTSFVQVTIYDASNNILKQAYLELHSSDNNSNWHSEGLPLVTLASGTPAFIEFYAQSSYSNFPTVSGSIIYIDNIVFNNCSTPIVSSFSQTTCQPYVWNGQTYSATGSYSQQFTSLNGCDSTATLNLTVVNPGALTSVPDPVFEQKLIDLGYDPCGVLNGFIPTNYINTVTSLDLFNGAGITNLTGIEDFTALQSLTLNGANLATNGINLSSNNQLKNLFLNANLTSLNLTQNVNLETLSLGDVIGTNNIGTLDLTTNINLQFINCAVSGITSLNLPSTSTLTDIDCRNNSINSLNLSVVPNLQNLTASNNNLIDLGTNSNNSIQKLDLNNNSFTGLNLSNFSQLKNIDCSNNQLECLNLKNGINNQFTNVKTQNNFNLTCIDVDDSTYSTNNPTWNAGIDLWSSFNINCAGNCITADLTETLLQEFKIYPNPSLNFVINVKVEDKVIGKKYRILDFKGDVLLNGTIHLSNEKIDLSGLTAGIYLFQIEGIDSCQKLILE